MLVIIKKSVLIRFMTFIRQAEDKECTRFNRQWWISFIALKTKTLDNILEKLLAENQKF